MNVTLQNLLAAHTGFTMADGTQYLADGMGEIELSNAEHIAFLIQLGFEMIGASGGGGNPSVGATGAVQMADGGGAFLDTHLSVDLTGGYPVVSPVGVPVVQLGNTESGTATEELVFATANPNNTAQSSSATISFPQVLLESSDTGDGNIASISASPGNFNFSATDTPNAFIWGIQAGVGTAHPTLLNFVATDLSGNPLSNFGFNGLPLATAFPLNLTDAAAVVSQFITNFTPHFNNASSVSASVLMTRVTDNTVFSSIRVFFTSSGTNISCAATSVVAAQGSIPQTALVCISASLYDIADNLALPVYADCYDQTHFEIQSGTIILSHNFHLIMQVALAIN